MRPTRQQFVALCLAASWGCADKNPSAPVTPLPAQSMDNVHYGADPLQVMDVRRPAGRSGTTTGVVVFITRRWMGGRR